MSKQDPLTLRGAQVELQPVADMSSTDTLSAAVVGRIRQGDSVICGMALLGERADLRELIDEDLDMLRAALVDRYAPDDVHGALIIDEAITALIQARRSAMVAATVLADGVDRDHVKRAETLDRMSDRASKRFTGLLDMLERRQPSSVTVSLAAIEIEGIA